MEEENNSKQLQRQMRTVLTSILTQSNNISDKIFADECFKVRDDLKDRCLVPTRIENYVTQEQRQDIYNLQYLVENQKLIQKILNINIKREGDYTIVEFLEGNDTCSVKFTLDPSSGKCLDFNAREILSQKEEETLRKAHNENLPKLLYEIRKILKQKLK